MSIKMEEFQRNIKRLSDMVSTYIPPEDEYGTPKAFDIEGGQALVWTFHERDSVFIGQCYVPPGCVIPLHHHNAKEVLTVFEGGGTYESKDVIRWMRPGSCVASGRGEAHKFTAGDNGVWFSVTTVPREEGLSHE